MIFSSEEYETIEQLAGIGYSLKQIALYFDIKEKDVIQSFYAPNSKLKYHYKRGILLSETAENLKMQESANKGNITAKQIIDKKRAKIEFEEHKRRILYGAEERDEN